LIAAKQPAEPVVLRRVVQRDRPLVVRERGRELPLKVLGDPDVRVSEERLVPVATRLGCREHLRQQRSPALDLATLEVADRQPCARHAEPYRVVRRCAQSRRSLVGSHRFQEREAARTDERASEGELEAQLARVALHTRRLRLHEDDRLSELPDRLLVSRARLRPAHPPDRST